MKNRKTILAAVALGLGLSLFGGASMALAGTLTGSNYHVPCGAEGFVFTSCVRPGGGQTVVLTGTALSNCVAIVQMGGGWSGSAPLTVNGDGTQMSFVVPNASNFYGWAAISGCSLDNSNAFLSQWSGYARPDPAITVTANSETLTEGETPVLHYTATNAANASDWATEPVCRAYLPSDLSTPVSGALAAGEYVSHCENGDPNADADVNYVDGQITVTAASGGSTGSSGSSDSSRLASTGVNESTLISLGVAAGLLLAVGGLLVSAGVWILPARRRIGS